MEDKKNKKNLWILTEERPKPEVIITILNIFAKDRSIACIVSPIRILPILEEGKFKFLYEVIGFHCNKVKNIYIKSISGFSSFVDFLIFYKDEQPTQSDIPIYAIEETKTDDKESRNTGVYQRASKFVFMDLFHRNINIEKIMLYNLKVGQKDSPTDTYIFGTNLLLTLGVRIEGKVLESSVFKPFNTVNEIIDFKSRMRQAPAGNVGISIKQSGNKIEISGRLIKSGNLAHDPNIGALSLICAALRKLGWGNDIIITEHGLSQSNLSVKNKFIQIANLLDIKIDGLTIPESQPPANYWKYETEGEKLGTIFIHLVVENFTEGYAIFENHAGCEKGYFITKEGNHIPLEKYSDRQAYKNGNKNKIISIPDLILIDFEKCEIINVEGKKYENMKQGIKDLDGFGDIEELYIKKYYHDFEIIRTVVLYGGTEEKIEEIKVGFLLNKNGDLILAVWSPCLFKQAIKNLKDYWL